MSQPSVLLSRELRFGVLESSEEMPSENSFAGNPALVGAGAFVKIAAQVRGAVDPRTGMLVNIKEIDQVLRRHAVPVVRAYYRDRPGGGAADLMLRLFADTGPRLRPRELAALSLSLSPYLTLTIRSKEPGVVEMSERFEFSAAHRLHSDSLSEAENDAVFGKCDNPNGHGHNYELEVTVAGVPDATTGQVVSVAALQQAVNARVIDVFDHKHLNLDCAEFRELNPTVENIARVVFEKLTGAFGAGGALKRVRVWETPKTWAQYPGE